MTNEDGSLLADEGKIFKRVSDGEILGAKITLGVNDSPYNYIEVDAPVDAKDEKSVL